MGDKIINTGQIGVIGSHAYVQDATFIQNQFPSGIELERLCEQLSQIRAKMQKDEHYTASPEQLAEIGRVASAEIEAKKGNAKGVTELLKKAGKWTLDTATKIGAGLAIEVIKKAAGM